MKKLVIICLLMSLGLVSYAQDVITLRNGDQLKGKVTEISSTEIRYKRADNPDGPVVELPKADVFTISYENGTREVINTASTTATASASTVPASHGAAPRAATGGPHEKNYYTGIYFNPLGFALAGPMLGAEFTIKRHFIIDAHLRFLSLGLLSGVLAEGGSVDVTNMSGIGIGVGGKYFTGRNRGGFYVGPVVEYYSQSYDYDDNYKWDGTGIIIAANLGYKFQFRSGFYMRVGGYLGYLSYSGDSYSKNSRYSIYEEGSEAFYSAEFGLGIAF